MSEEKDQKRRDELKEVIESSNLDEALKNKLLSFAEELKNGRLEQLLDNIKERINEN